LKLEAALADWQLLQSWLDQWAALLSKFAGGIGLAAIGMSVALAIVIARSGIVARRRAKVLRVEIAHLQEDVKRLLITEDRRFLMGLKSPAKSGANTSIIPTSADSPASTSRVRAAESA
jgi:hypothetical protein